MKSNCIILFVLFCFYAHGQNTAITVSEKNKHINSDNFVEEMHKRIIQVLQE